MKIIGNGALAPSEKEKVKIVGEAKASLPKKKNRTIGKAEASLPKKKNRTIGEAKASLPKDRNGALAPSKHSHLPHIDIEGYYQFITFRTYDSIDEYLKRLYNIEKPNKQKQQIIDNYLDNSKNGAYLNGDALEYLYDFFKSKDNILYELVAFSIMPNHIHILFKPLDKLSIVMQKIKGATANHINKILNTKGKFWASNYYDKAIRDERHFFVVYEYIKHNPLKLYENIGEAKASLPKDGNGALAPSEKRFYGIFDKG